MEYNNGNWGFEVDIDEGIVELSNRIGLSPDFIVKLLKEDDWSFIIKLHALIEAVCTQLILYHFKEPALSSIIARLELSNKPIGKVALLKELELLDEYHRKYIYALSELRNGLVHDVKQSNFNLKEMVNSYKKEELKRFAKVYSPLEMIIIDNNELKNKSNFKLNLTDQFTIENIINRAKEEPKFHIWLGAYSLLITIVDVHGFSDYKNSGKYKQIIDEYQ